MSLKTKVINNLILNIFNCSFLCLAAQLLTILQGNLDHFILPMFFLNFVVAYIAANLTGMIVPCEEIAQKFCRKLNLKPGQAFGIVMGLCISFLYTVILSLVMTFLNVVIMGGGDGVAFFFGFITGFLPLWLVSFMVSSIFSGFAMKMARKITGEK